MSLLLGRLVQPRSYLLLPTTDAGPNSVCANCRKDNEREGLARVDLLPNCDVDKCGKTVAHYAEGAKDLLSIGNDPLVVLSTI
jgi:hypothetical protein